MHDQPPEPGLKGLYKRLVRKLTRAGLVELEERLEAIERAVSGEADRVAVWRGTLSAGAATLDDGREVPALTSKYRGELAFWVNLARDPSPHPGFERGFEATFGTWQRDRLLELGRCLGLRGEAALASWCAERVAVEIGAGPYPVLAAAEWKVAVAVDPLADGYVSEGLLPVEAHADRLVYIAAAGERVPLASASADLVVMENCLDHVSDPARVLAETRRLLRPGGLCWLLVDLMDYRDEQHPHAFNEPRLRALLTEAGFETVHERVSDHKSHPQAYGELRALLRKPGAAPLREPPSAEVRRAEPVSPHAPG